MRLPDASHRPWYLPQRPWVMFMRWERLLFMHWPVPADVLRPFIPRRLELETFDGTAWIGVVPFIMSGTRVRLTPALPGLSRFPELNVRTYVTAEGKPGVWFFSLDAARRAAVWGARRTFHLPYYFASMHVSAGPAEWMDYVSRRRSAGTLTAEFEGRYRPSGAVYRSSPDSLDYWLTERYCLYAADAGHRLWRGEIHHRRWPLQPAEAEIETNSMTGPLGVALPNHPPLLHYASALEAYAWWPERVGDPC